MPKESAAGFIGECIAGLMIPAYMCACIVYTTWKVIAAVAAWVGGLV